MAPVTYRTYYDCGEETDLWRVLAPGRNCYDRFPGPYTSLMWESKERGLGGALSHGAPSIYQFHFDSDAGVIWGVRRDGSPEEHNSNRPLLV